jgi:hypothetical protein
MIQMSGSTASHTLSVTVLVHPPPDPGEQETLLYSTSDKQMEAAWNLVQGRKNAIQSCIKGLQKPNLALYSYDKNCFDPVIPGGLYESSAAWSSLSAMRTGTSSQQR